ncbi:Trihelix transcription factor GTL2 GT2-LIKE protein [Vigna angularis]|uniref:Trihelix transcription factor GTL2 GT2-LIKE protein n=1 Tax=Phaseolus angularis TaxID=3914 RepID=A0A8T0L455_PHAAN|nr:Trihelix transcription factor GTL2 GT2-LIKE protein [Vigna angularis]
MKTIRGQKLAELGFKMTAEKCKKKFEDESGYFDNVSNYGKNNYRFLSELEELCQNPYSGGGDGDCDGDEGIVRSEKTLLHLGADNMGHRQCDGTDDKVVVEKSKERKRKRRDRFEMFKGFCESFVNKMMAQQEEIHNRLLKDMVKRDQEKFSKEEAWKKQEMERMNKELDIMAQEHAIAGDKHATIIEFLKDDIKVVIHHGGKLVNEGCLKYERESDTMYFDPDLWSYFVVVSVVKGLGYDGFKDLWFSIGCGPVLDDKLEPLCDDVGVMHMVNFARLNGQVHFYVVHTVSEPELIDMIEYNVDEGGEEIAPEMHEGGECAVLDERTEEDDGGVTSQFGEATYDGVDGHGERIEVDVGEGDKIEVDVGEGQRIEVDAGEVDIIQDDVGEDERIQVHVGEVDKMEVHVGEGDRIQIDVGEGERIEVDEGHDVEGKRIEDDESHDDRTQANDVEETIEVHETHHQSTEANDVEETIVVDEAHDERTEVNDLESETMEVDEAHDERIVVNDGEGNRTEVEELEDIEAQGEEPTSLAEAKAHGEEAHGEQPHGEEPHQS